MLNKHIPLDTVMFAITLALVVSILGIYGYAHADRTSVNAGAGVQTVTACNIASSTMAFVQSPFGAATSTATLVEVKGTNAATSTDILIATSTTSAPAGLAVATSSVHESIMGLFAVPANAQFYSVAGQSIGPSAGYNVANGGTYQTHTYTVVGPNEGILLFSTSTNPTGNGGLTASTLGVPSSCTIVINWVQ